MIIDYFLFYYYGSVEGLRQYYNESKEKRKEKRRKEEKRIEEKKGDEMLKNI